MPKVCDLSLAELGIPVANSNHFLFTACGYGNPPARDDIHRNSEALRYRNITRGRFRIVVWMGMYDGKSVSWNRSFVIRLTDVPSERPAHKLSAPVLLAHGEGRLLESCETPSCVLQQCPRVLKEIA